MNFIHKHLPFLLWLFQGILFMACYRFFPSWTSLFFISIICGMLRVSPWSWWKTPTAHLLGLVLGATHDHLWNVAEVVASIVGLPYPIIYLILVAFITTLTVSITAQAVWSWMPWGKKS